MNRSFEMHFFPEKPPAHPEKRTSGRNYYNEP